MRKQEAIKRYLHQVSPVDSSESLEAIGKEPTLAKHIERADASDAEKEHASSALEKIGTGAAVSGTDVQANHSVEISQDELATGQAHGAPGFAPVQHLSLG